MSEPILNFVACPWCTSGNAADMWHWGKCPGAAERDRRARDAVAEMYAALDAPVATATADQLRRKLLECEEALRTTEARAEKAEQERDALAGLACSLWLNCGDVENGHSPHRLTKAEREYLRRLVDAEWGARLVPIEDAP